jgi:hypothetical protein
MQSEYMLIGASFHSLLKDFRAFRREYTWFPRVPKLQFPLVPNSVWERLPRKLRFARCHVPAIVVIPPATRHRSVAAFPMTTIIGPESVAGKDQAIAAGSARNGVSREVRSQTEFGNEGKGGHCPGVSFASLTPPLATRRSPSGTKTGACGSFTFYDCYFFLNTLSAPRLLTVIWFFAVSNSNVAAPSI